MIAVEQLHKAFESRIRLGIMSVLLVNDWVEFREREETLNVRDGHLAALERLIKASQ